MNKTLKNPFDLLDTRKESPTVTTASDSEKTVTTAAHSLDNTDTCPNCKHDMKRVKVHRGISANACFNCRICLPIKN